MDIDQLLIAFSKYTETVVTNDSFISAAVTACIFAFGLAIHAYLQRRGKKREMTRKQQELVNRRLADHLGDAMLTMLARDLLTPTEYREKMKVIAHALGIADMLPLPNQKALKNKIKAARKQRADHPEPKPNIPGEQPIQDVGPKKEQDKKQNVMERFKKAA